MVQELDLKPFLRGANAVFLGPYDEGLFQALTGGFSATVQFSNLYILHYTKSVHWISNLILGVQKSVKESRTTDLFYSQSSFLKI